MSDSRIKDKLKSPCPAINRLEKVQKLPMAYVLLNTKIGSGANVLEEIRRIEGVQEAFNLWGVYDIIARIEADSMEKLTAIINEKLQATNIHSKLTVIVTEPLDQINS